jgi:hypothetical protein
MMGLVAYNDLYPDLVWYQKKNLAEDPRLRHLAYQ